MRPEKTTLTSSPSSSVPEIVVSKRTVPSSSAARADWAMIAPKSGALMSSSSSGRQDFFGESPGILEALHSGSLARGTHGRAEFPGKAARDRDRLLSAKKKQPHRGPPMYWDWDKIATISSVIGVIGGIVSVIFLVYEVRHNAKAIEGATVQSLMGLEREVFTLLVQNADLFGCRRGPGPWPRRRRRASGASGAPACGLPRRALVACGDPCATRRGRASDAGSSRRDGGLRARI